MKTTRHIAVFLFFIFQALQVYATESMLDSLINKLDEADASDRVDLLNDISREYWSVSLEKSHSYALKALELATGLNDTARIANAMNRLGNAYYLNGNYQEALNHYNKSLEKRLGINDYDGTLGSYNNLYLLHDRLGNKEKVADYVEKAVELSIQTGDKSGIASYSNILGVIKSNRHDFDNAITCFGRALEIYTETNNIEGIASTLNNMGGMYQRMSLYDRAQECFHEALPLYRKTDDITGVASVLNNIGITHRQIGNLDIALNFYNRSLKLYKEKDVGSTSTASVLNNIGIIWYEKGDYETALDYYSRALVNYENFSDSHGIAVTSHNTGIIHTRLKNYQDALESYLKSVDINKTAGNNYSLANNYNNLGELYLLKNDYNIAIEYLEKGLEIALNLSAKDLISENYLFRSHIYEETNQFEKALASYSHYNTYRDSIFTEDMGNKIAELQIMHKRASLDNELELLLKTSDIQQLQLQQVRSLIIYLVIISVISGLCISILLGMYRYRIVLNHSLQEKNQQLESAHSNLVAAETNLIKLNNAKDKFFSIIAHDLKNPFNALLGFSETLIHKYNDLSREQIYTYIDIINKSATSLYQLLENLLEWSKSQTGNINYIPEKFQVKEVADREIFNLIPAANRKNISIQTEISPNITAFADKNIISAVIRNLLNNAIKFTFYDGTILISARETRKKVEVSVSDNGVGISKVAKKKLFSLDYNVTTTGTNDEKGTGLGLLLCKEFVEKSGGTLWVDSKPGKGSTFTFTIPV